MEGFQRCVYCDCTSTELQTTFLTDPTTRDPVCPACWDAIYQAIQEYGFEEEPLEWPLAGEEERGGHAKTKG